MGNIGGGELMLILFIFVIPIVFLLIPFWQIFKRAGFPPALSLLMLVPMVNLAMIYFLAFAKWPSLKQN